ncbi:MAG: choice-of-anchor J domain-containing protein [Flavobacteriaceae bacterium]|jgi:gliding motility-associated-like protein|nr:choice-of-anchor J domain-containing protein [Flavobacteriaceae bacterium]
MKNNKTLFTVLLFALGAFIYALNTQLSWKGLFSVFENNLHSDIGDQHQKSNNVTQLGKKAFAISLSKNVLLEDDFENSTGNWTFTKSTFVEWYIGSAVKSSGTKSMYISKDKGISNSYEQSGGRATIHAVSKVLTLDATTIDYLFSFDWRAKGESGWDDLQLWLVPEAYVPTEEVAITTSSSNGVEIAKVDSQVDFINVKIIKDLSKFQGQKVKIVFQWRHDTSGDYDPPGAVDNFEFAKVTCKAPELSDLKVSNITQTDATFTWKAPIGSTAVDYDLYVSDVNTSPNVNATIINVKNATTYTVSNLSDTKYYYVWYRSSCATGDESFWVGPLKFMTLCTPIKLPLTENFDVTSTTLGCWTTIDANGDVTTSKDNSWNLSTTEPSSGDGVMYFKGENKLHNDYLVAPTTKMTGGIYRIEFEYKTKYVNEDLELVLSTTGKAATDFTQIVLAKANYQTGNYRKKVAFVKGITGNVTLAWHLTTNGESNFWIDNVSIKEVTCLEATDLAVNNETSNSVNLSWKGDNGTNYEYFVQDLGSGIPTNAGISTNSTSVVVNQTSIGTALASGTFYEFYVRVKCGDNSFGEYVGPFIFKTACDSIITLPFTETFNTSSTTINCWKIVDQNNDQSNDGLSRVWRKTTSNTYEGDGAMYLTGSAKPHNDWLISPAFTFATGKLYEIEYFYRSTASTEAEIEILGSVQGTDIDKFSVILPKTKIKTGNYTKGIVYVDKLVGKVNLAWRATSSGSTTIYLDKITIREVGCKGPDQNVVVSNLEKDKVTVTWIDDSNSSWEIYVQNLGAAPTPTGGGSGVNAKTTTITRTTGATGGLLQPNTEYEFFVRANCGGGKFSSWVGPIKFKTPCDVMTLPFTEGFNSDSPTLSCWNVINNIGSGSTTNFGKYTYNNYEGDAHMYMSNYSDTKTDHYLISPNFRVVANKIYKLTYYYKTSTYYKGEFELLLSSSGRTVTDYKTVLTPLKNYQTSTWTEKVAYVSGLTGDISIAWHAKSDNNVEIHLDLVTFEEVACAEPTDLDVKDVKDTEAKITWTDKFNAEWEYAVLPVSSTMPKAPKTSGINTKSIPVTITKDFNGLNLQSNSRYVYYVRAKCKDGVFGNWVGPIEFYTECGVQKLPFWEGFNSTSKTNRCWTILDIAGDGDSYSNKWSLYEYSMFEGDQAMRYNSYYEDDVHDDWLITPEFNALPNKYYRLKYHYRGSISNTAEVAVKLSTIGVSPADFTKTLIPSKVFNDYNYTKETIFFTGVSGKFHIGFHLTGEGSTSVYIDNLFVEEVTGCIEPLNVKISNITKSQAEIEWTDAYGATKWEYFVQEAGLPVPTTSGTVTTTKKNTITKDSKGNTLVPGQEYDVYVRTVCTNGEYSIWQDAVEFMTICDVFPISFIESFDKNSLTAKCWTIIDSNDDEYGWDINTSYPYEGDKAASLYGNSDGNDDWLISPTVKMTTANYLLKFRYQTNNPATSVPMEVLLSTTGLTPVDFKTTLIGKKVYKNANYVEEVLFFKGIAADVNIGWHVLSDMGLRMNIDNISLTEVKTCPEPTNVKVTATTTTSIDVEWQQTGGITNWEVIAIPHGATIPITPTNVITVSGTAKATISSLVAGKLYNVYVRAKCNVAGDHSEWSTKLLAGPKTDNDDCSQAKKVTVTKGLECATPIPGSTIGTTVSPGKAPSCVGSTIVTDVWYEFTAIDSYMTVTLNDFVANTGAKSPTIYMSLFDADCTTATAPTTSTAIKCNYVYNKNGKYETLFSDLVVGKKYFLRISFPIGEYYYNLCLNSNPDGKLIVVPSGDKYNNVDYTVDHLVKKVLINSNCELVENIKYQAGNKSSINTLGYFNRGKSNFPFQDGIVLTTQAITKTAGPYDPDVSKQKVPSWVGDPDLNDVIKSIGGAGFGDNKYVSILEFDFTPVKDSIKFEYLFASESYVSWCSYQCKGGGALFAAWLTEINSGEGQNLALVPGTDMPIALSTIRDKEKVNSSCESINPQYFDKNYYETERNPLESSINYTGQTVPMSSEIVHVKPGIKYRIKLAIADFCGTSSHTSAVFFKAGSFDLGNLDLGADLLVDTGNALCDASSKTIKSGLSSDEKIVAIQWEKDGKVIPGATKPDYEVTETGTYTVRGQYKNPVCPVEGSVKVEIFPPITSIVNAPKDLNICKHSLNDQNIDLVSHTNDMFVKTSRDKYETTFYLDKELKTKIVTPAAYSFKEFGTEQIVYVLVKDIRSKCTYTFAMKLVPTDGDKPTKPADVAVCDTYALPMIKENQKYFSEAGGKGQEYKGGHILNAGEYTIYLLQENGKGCYEEVSFEVKVTKKEYSLVFENRTMMCEMFVLTMALPNNSKYYKEVNGIRVELPLGTVITEDNTTIFVVTKSEDGLCYDESKFTIHYEDCPIPKGFSPNSDGVNDRFDLSQHGATSIKIFNRNGSEVYSFAGIYTNQWDGKGTNGKELPSGTYYYVIQTFTKTKTGWVELNR